MLEKNQKQQRAKAKSYKWIQEGSYESLVCLDDDLSDVVVVDEEVSA
jgi:hypothetical protein